MKFYVYLALFCMISIKVNANDLSIVLLQKNIKLKDTLSLQLINDTSAQAFYYIGLEKKIDDEWREVILDVSSFSYRKAALKTIAGNSTKEIHVSWRSISNRNSKFYSHGLFRIKLNYDFIKIVNKTTYSEEFEIKSE